MSVDAGGLVGPDDPQPDPEIVAALKAAADAGLATRTPEQDMEMAVDAIWQDQFDAVLAAAMPTIRAGGWRWMSTEYTSPGVVTVVFLDREMFS